MVPVQEQAAGEEAQGQAGARLSPHHTPGSSARSLRHSRALGWAHGGHPCQVSSAATASTAAKSMC